MATTIIDALIVTLGLDAAGFKKGTGEATRQTKYTQDVIKKSSEAMTRSLKDVTRQVAVMFLGFETATGLVSFLARLNQAQASLSRMALNLGLSARSLDVWDKKIELAGGTAQGAQAAIQQLMSDLTAMLTLGASASPLVILFNKMKVGLDGAAFSGEKAKASYDALFEALGKLPRSTAFELGTQAGLSPDLLNYGLRPPAEREALAKEAERLSRTTEANAKAADDLRERWVAIRETLEGIGVVFLEKITPAIERLLPVVEKLGNGFADWIASFNTPQDMSLFDHLDQRVDKVLDKVRDIRDELHKIMSGDFSDVGTAIKNNLKSSFKSPSEAWEDAKKNDVIFGSRPESAWSQIKRFFAWTPGAPYADAFRESAERHHLPPGLLESVADRESSFDPTKIGGIGERGIMQLRPEFYPNAGKDPKADIETAAGELERYYKAYGNWPTALAAYNDGQKNLAAHLANQGAPPDSTQRYVTAIGNEMQRARYTGTIDRSGTPHTSVQIDSVVIQTRATDGQQVAVDFMAEMKKRDLLWQADTGLVP